MNTENKTNLPPHLIKAVERYEQKQKELKKEFNIIDRTPKGYGPAGDEGQ